MTADPLAPYTEVWLVDFEFRVDPGERPEPICMVAREYRTARTIRLWGDGLRTDHPPFDIGERSLYVAYYASAELGCHLALGWPMPRRILDLYAEFSCVTSGLPPPHGRSLLGALAWHGLDAIEAAEKGAMRALALRGGRYTESERSGLLVYCESDVVALAKLLPAMLPKIDLPRALLRGRSMAAAARIEWQGVPIDADLLDALRSNWTVIKSALTLAVDADFGVYVPTGRRELDPDSRLGAVILSTASEWQIDPHRLAAAVDYVWAQEREKVNEHTAALTAARKTTGLTTNRIDAWECGGQRDYSTFPGLDVTARDLAGEYPELGVGAGYQEEGGYDPTDYAGELWGLLREPARTAPPKHDPNILRRAAEMVADEPAVVGMVGPLSFSAKRFAGWLTSNGIPWPRTDTGALALDDKTFRSMARQYPAVSALRELRHTLGELRLNDLSVGRDGRNRCLLSAFASKTGRNQPSNSKFIFGPSVWLRGLIKPGPDRAVAYIDWEQQEFGIAAALSGDRAMIEAYRSGDPYLAFAKQAGAAPADATKASHGAVRDQFKVCALAVQYGMGETSLAESLGSSPAHARELLTLHRRTYPTFWKWSQAAVDTAMLTGALHTVFGWRVHVGTDANPRSLANFPMQANGAEMLRLACCLTTERGIEVCAPVHDALLIEAAADGIESAVTDCKAAMAEASRVVLDGFELRTDAAIVTYPDRFMDEKRGAVMWQKVMQQIGAMREADGSNPPATELCSTS